MRISVTPSCPRAPVVSLLITSSSALSWSEHPHPEPVVGKRPTFQISSHNGRSDQGCENVIMLITDGAPNVYKEIFDLYNKDKKVTVPLIHSIADYEASNGKKESKKVEHKGP